jgi:protease secretion system membrane fusion protein
MSDQLSSAMLAKLKELNAPPGAPQPVDAVDKAENRLNTEKSDTARAMRVGLWALGIGFGGFLLWAGLAPLDEGVPSPAMVTIDTKRKPVQHQTGGIIKEVLVGEGTVVKAGQTLIRLDDAVAEATHQASRQRYLALRAMEGRLLAEQANRSSIEFHKDLVEAAKSDPVIARHVQNQEQLFLTRKAAVAADQQSMAESIQGQEGMLKSYASMLEGRATQLRLLNEELGQYKGTGQRRLCPAQPAVRAGAAGGRLDHGHCRPSRQHDQGAERDRGNSPAHAGTAPGLSPGGGDKPLRM